LEISFLKTVTSNDVPGSSGSGDPMLWELRVERLNAFYVKNVGR